jgi:hypothetical protein
VYINGVHFEEQPVCPSCGADITKVREQGWALHMECSCGWKYSGMRAGGMEAIRRAQGPPRGGPRMPYTDDD